MMSSAESVNVLSAAARPWPAPDASVTALVSRTLSDLVFESGHQLTSMCGVAGGQRGEGQTIKFCAPRRARTETRIPSVDAWNVNIQLAAMAPAAARAHRFPPHSVALELDSDRRTRSHIIHSLFCGRLQCTGSMFAASHRMSTDRQPPLLSPVDAVFTSNGQGQRLGYHLLLPAPVAHGTRRQLICMWRPPPRRSLWP